MTPGHRHMIVSHVLISFSAFFNGQAIYQEGEIFTIVITPSAQRNINVTYTQEIYVY